jgi:polar amino acid transport system permease protein
MDEDPDLPLTSYPSTHLIPLPDKGKRRFDRWWLLFLLVVIAFVLLITLVPDPYMRSLRFVSDGLVITIYFTFASFVFVLLLGLVGGLGRVSSNRFFYGISSLYVEIIRGIPLLVQLFMWAFAVPPLIKSLGATLHIPSLATYSAQPIPTAIFGLAFCYGAYMTEIVRAGIQSVPKGQMEAARSLGMSYWQSMRHIILPQAVRMILPPVGNEFVTLLKDTSLVSVIGVGDLTRRGREFMATYGLATEGWLLVAILYLMLTLLGARLVSWLETRTQTER